MEMHLNGVNWIEIPVSDFERAKNFYSAIFDYEMPEMPMPNGNRMGIFLHDRMNGGVGGAIVAGKGYEPTDKGAIVYLNGGSDLNIVLSRVEGAGGSVHVHKTMIGPGMGHFAIFRDPEGNRVGLHSND